MFSFRIVKNKLHFIFLALFLITTQTFSDDKIHTVLVLKDWKPYYSLDKNGKPTGYAIELFETLAKEVGIKYEYKLFENWAQMNPHRKSGKEYIVPNTGIAQIRADHTLFSNPTDTFQIKYFKRKTSYDINNKEDLKNKKVVIVNDNVCEKLVKNGNIQKVFYDCHLVSLNALVSGEVDAMCYPKPLLDSAIKSLHLSNKIVSFAEPLKEIKRSLGFSYNNAYLVPLFNEQLQKLKEDGRYEKIYQKWFGEKEGIKLSYEEIVLLTATLIILMIIIFFILYYTSRRNKWLLTQSELKLSSATQKCTNMQSKDVPLCNTYLLEISNNPASLFCFNL